MKNQVKNATPIRFNEFLKGYIRKLSTLLNEIDSDVMDRFVKLLMEVREKGNTVFIIGNGGSAATATHMANDLCNSQADRSGRRIRALSLADNLATMTALANDQGYNQIFVKQLECHYRTGDILVVISASGNSPNVTLAAEWMKCHGGVVVGFVGFDGGALRNLTDICLHVRTNNGEYGLVEDIHMIMDHILYSWFKASVEGSE